jgi:tetratricopeptide (TPR) repeat protein
MQADIAMNIANALEAEFSLAERTSIETVPTESAEAYALYLQALSMIPSAAQQSLLGRAIALDSEFALAYALRARTHAENLLGTSGTNPAQAAEFERLVREDAVRALKLDPTLGQAHAALATIHYANWRGSEAEEAFRQAYELRPDPDLLLEYGRFKRYRGEYEDAIRLQREGYALDPNNGFLHYQLGLSYSAGGHYKEADDIFRQGSELDPAFPPYHLQIGRIAARLGNGSEALRQLRLAETLWEGIELNAFRVGQLAIAYSEAGSTQDVLRMWNALQDLAKDQPVGHAVWARAFLATGDSEQALIHVAAAVTERASTDLPTLSELAENPWGNPILDEPEFRELLNGLWN